MPEPPTRLIYRNQPVDEITTDWQVLAHDRFGGQTTIPGFPNPDTALKGARIYMTDDPDAVYCEIIWVQRVIQTRVSRVQYDPAPEASLP